MAQNRMKVSRKFSYVENNKEFYRQHQPKLFLLNPQECSFGIFLQITVKPSFECGSKFSCYNVLGKQLSPLFVLIPSW
jgi:hypothetical protein